MINISKFLNQEVDVLVDRPIGSKHPDYGFIYSSNYGYVPNSIGADGEPIDAYILGKDESLSHFKGYCIAIIRRLDDDDDKLIVVEKGNQLSDEQIIAATSFQEQFFESTILR